MQALRPTSFVCGLVVKAMYNNLKMSTIINKIESNLSGSSDNKNLRPLVTISFDDGYASDYNVVFPIFQELGLRGTFYALPVPNGATDEHMAEMAQAGQEIATHGGAHIPYNIQPDVATIYNDMLAGKKRIENATNKEVLTMAYPFGGGDSGTGTGTIENALITQNVAGGLFEAARGTRQFTTTHAYGGKDVNHKFYRETYFTPYGTPDLFNIPCHLADGTPDWVITLIDYLLELDEPAWYNVAFHRIYTDGDSTKPSNRLYESEFRTVIEYIADKKKQKLLDVVPFYEGARRITGARSNMLNK